MKKNTERIRKQLNDNKLNSEEQWRKAAVFSRAGKATGNNRNCYNIQNDESEERKCVDLSRLPWENADTQTPVHVQEFYISDINEGEMKQKRLSKQLKKRSNRNSS